MFETYETGNVGLEPLNSEPLVVIALICSMQQAVHLSECHSEGLLSPRADARAGLT